MKWLFKFHLSEGGKHCCSDKRGERGESSLCVRAEDIVLGTLQPLLLEEKDRAGGFPSRLSEPGWIPTSLCFHGAPG